MGFASTAENAPTKVELWLLLGLCLGRWNHLDGGSWAVLLTQATASAFFDVMLHFTAETIRSYSRFEGVADCSGFAS